MGYKCLKKGWLPYREAFQKYIKKGDVTRFIYNVPDEYKELINRNWFVKEEWFKAYAEGRVNKEYIIKED